MEYNALFLEKPFELQLRVLKSPSTKRLAKMHRSGVCGTDKHMIKGEIKFKGPLILGHENVASIDEQRVTWPAIMPCKKCKYCLMGMMNVCEKNRIFGLTRTKPPSGGWAEYTNMPKGAILFKVPDSIDDDSAVLIESMASTKILKEAPLKGKSLLIIGSGTIGLLSAIHAKSKGAGQITIIGHKEQARLIGGVVDRFFEKGTKADELAEGFDFVMDAGGNKSSFEFAAACVKPKGTVLESGCMVDSLEVNIAGIIKKEVKIATQLGYVPKDFEWAIKLVDENKKIVRKIITHRFKLSDYQRAVDVMLKKNHGKILFVTQ